MRAVPSLALVVTLAAAPLAAQPYDDRIVEACLAAHWGGQNDREACIGIAARVCMPVGEGGADTAIACHEAETAQWAALLDETLAALRAQLGEAEGAAKNGGESEGEPGGEPEAVQALDRAQLAWESFRDATCGFDALRWPDADIGRADRAECLMRLTARQALEMQSRLTGTM